MLVPEINARVAFIAVFSILGPDDEAAKAESGTEFLNLVHLPLFHKMLDLPNETCVEVLSDMHLLNSANLCPFKHM
jgi:hypothetical protein